MCWSRATGRCGPGAFGAIRVMVTANQTGEAAGLACALACDTGCGVAEVDVARLQQKLNAAGAVVGDAGMTRGGIDGERK